MLDIPSFSAIIAAIGVLIGVALTVLELRHLRKQRQTDLVVRLYSPFTSDDFIEAFAKIRNLEFEDYKDFVKKYGSLSLDTRVSSAILKVANYYDEVGTLLHKGLIDADMVSEFLTPATINTWNKLKPIIEGIREDGGVRFSLWFEYLYNEMKKREQKLQQKGVKNG